MEEVPGINGPNVQDDMILDEIPDIILETPSDQPEAPKSSQRTPLEEIAHPSPSPVAGPAEPPMTAPRLPNEMIRLLDDHRARLLGPQDLTRASHAASNVPSTSPEVPIFEDQGEEDVENESEGRDEDDKENTRPVWDGQTAPRAPGARRLSPVPSAAAVPLMGQAPLSAMPDQAPTAPANEETSGTGEAAGSEHDERGRPTLLERFVRFFD